MKRYAAADIIRNDKTRIWGGLSSAFITLIAEGGINFFRYLKSLGILQRSNFILLSSKHEYYYDRKDLKNAGILVNLRKLNLIKHLDMFLNALVHILPPDASFIGFFSDNNSSNSNYSQVNLFSRLTDKLKSIPGINAPRVMAESEVKQLLERNGFKVVDMTKKNGLTYFYSQVTRRPPDLSNI